MNLQLLDETENKEKSATAFDVWISNRDVNFKTRHSIPEIDSYEFDNFLEFISHRRDIFIKRLKEFSI